MTETLSTLQGSAVLRSVTLVRTGLSSDREGVPVTALISPIEPSGDSGRKEGGEREGEGGRGREGRGRRMEGETEKKQERTIGKCRRERTKEKEVRGEYAKARVRNVHGIIYGHRPHHKFVSYPVFKVQYQSCHMISTVISIVHIHGGRFPQLLSWPTDSRVAGLNREASYLYTCIHACMCY